MLSSLAFKCVFLAKKLDINFFKVILNIKVVKSAFINRLENLSRIEQIGITVLSFFIVIAYIAFFYVDIPFYDQWDLLNIYDKVMQGTLTLNDLLVLNNEHRVVVQRIVATPIIYLTRWNVLAEIAVLVLSALGSLIVVACQLKRTMHHLGLPTTNWVLPLIALIVFSLNQWENWLNGDQLVYGLHVLAVVTGLSLITRQLPSPRRVLLAAALGVIATYTIAAGIVYFAVGLVVLLLSPVRSWHWTMVCIWVVVAIVTFSTYFYDFHPAQAPILNEPVLHPVEYTLYVLAFIGAPMLTYYVAPILGFIGIIAMMVSIHILLRHRGVPVLAILPYVALAAYSLGTGLLIGIGRLKFGWWQAISPRYIILSEWFWVGLVTLLYLVIKTQVLKHPTASIAQKLGQFAPLLVLGILAFSLVNSIGGFYLGLTLRSWPLAAARSQISLGNHNDSVLRQVSHDPEQVRRHLALMQKYKLSVYR